jgi:adenylate cyclase class IV
MNATPGSVQELEVKAAVPDAALLRRHLVESGAEAGFRGLMEDRLFDRDGVLKGRGEVLRVRTWRPDGAPARAQLAWKGVTRRSPEGMKLRDELQFFVDGDAGAPGHLLGALGYQLTQSIDRFVEIFRACGAEVRIEWYPRMDVLVEVEGTGAAIESALGVTGLPRTAFEPEPLAEFVRRYEARTGESAVLAMADLKEGRPVWDRR